MFNLNNDNDNNNHTNTILVVTTNLAFLSSFQQFMLCATAHHEESLFGQYELSIATIGLLIFHLADIPSRDVWSHYNYMIVWTPMMIDSSSCFQF